MASYSVSNYATDQARTFPGDGSTRVFPTPFPVFATSDLFVYRGDTRITTGFTIALVDTDDLPSIANVTFTTPPPSSDNIRFTLEGLPTTQEINFNAVSYDSANHNQAASRSLFVAAVLAARGGSGGGGGGGTPINLPIAISDVTDLQNALDGKADDSEITNIRNTLAGKADTSAIPDVSGFLTSAAAAATYAPITHDHTISQVTNLQNALDLKADMTAVTAAIANFITQQFADNRYRQQSVEVPLAEVTGLQSALDGKQDSLPSLNVGQIFKGGTRGTIVAADDDAGEMYLSVNSTGAAASATGDDAIAMGERSTAVGAHSLAVGEGARASGTNSVAMGEGVTSGGNNALAIGNQSSVDTGATNGIAVGVTAQASASNSLAIGVTTLASGEFDSALGYYAGSSAATSSRRMRGEYHSATNISAADLTTNGRFDPAVVANGFVLYDPTGIRQLRNGAWVEIGAGGGTVADASETVTGIVQLATATETQAAASRALAVTPFALDTFQSGNPVVRRDYDATVMAQCARRSTGGNTGLWVVATAQRAGFRLRGRGRLRSLTSPPYRVRISRNPTEAGLCVTPLDQSSECFPRRTCVSSQSRLTHLNPSHSIRLPVTSRLPVATEHRRR